MIGRWLRLAILVYLWGALAEDTIIFILAWAHPYLWFHLFHHSVPQGLEVALLRRSAGQWAAFALAQAIALMLWRKQPVWLAVVAGIRFSDLFTDISYIIAAPSLTPLGWIVLSPPAVLNLVGVVIMLKGFEQAGRAGAACR